MPTLKKIMNSSLVVCTPGTSIQQAATLMSSEKVFALPVVENNKLVGVLYDSDLLKIERPLKIPAVLGILGSAVYMDNPLNGDEVEKQIESVMAEEVSAVMNREFVFFNTETTIEQAAATMVDKNLHYAPVVEGDQLVGGVSSLDLIKLLAK